VVVAVVTAQPRKWRGDLVDQLDYTPGLWHWACAPLAIREYAPPMLGGDVPSNGPTAGILVLALACAFALAVIESPLNSIDSWVELLMASPNIVARP